MRKNACMSLSICGHTVRETHTHVVMPSLADPSHSMLGGERVSWRVLMVQVRSYRFYTLHFFRI
jgi:hypothetical protein